MKKSRIVSTPLKIGTYYDFGLGFQQDHVVTGFYDNSIVDTTNHPGWFFQDDASGYFDKRGTIIRRNPSQGGVTITNGINLYYHGSLTSGVANWAFPALTGNGTQWGAIAYDRMKPTKPLFSLFNMIYELKDLRGQLQQLERGFARNLSGFGQYYLSQVFGWMPLVSDVLTLLNHQQKLQKRIDWLLRNEGKWISRQVKLYEKETILWSNDWTHQYNSFEQSFTTQFYNSVPRFRQTQSVVDRIWATAQFKYFLPDAPPGVQFKKNHLKAALRGFHGIRMHQLYDAIPWTWLLSWCVDLSRVLENCDAGVADSLAARRFCIMREQVARGSQFAEGNFRGVGGSNVAHSSSSYAESHLKTRVLGNPFYPANPNSLSPGQLAVLGALGMSKLPS
jgi:hypothetical protein